MSKIAYPLISCKVKGSSSIMIHSLDDSLAKTIPRPVLIEGYGYRDGLIDKAIDFVRKGSIVLWIENTVKEAQDTYDCIFSKLPEESVGLLHSKFTLHDRYINEGCWVNRLGKNGDRSGCILVATQVCEQSLDIDADILFTSLCPIDMLLQRIGRIWRHRENDRYRNTINPLVFWFALDLRLEADKIKDKSSMFNFVDIYGKSAYVYSPYYLMRTMDLLVSKKVLNIPEDIRDVLESVYSYYTGYQYLKKLVDKKKEDLNNIAKEVLNSSSIFRTRPHNSVDEEDSLMSLIEPLLDLEKSNTSTRIGEATKKICLTNETGTHTIYGEIFLPDSKNSEDKRHILDATITLSMKDYSSVFSYVTKYEYTEYLNMKKMGDIYNIFCKTTGKVNYVYSNRKGWHNA